MQAAQCGKSGSHPNLLIWELLSERVAATSICLAKFIRLAYKRKSQCKRRQPWAGLDGWQSTAAPLQGHFALQPHMLRRGCMGKPQTPGGAVAPASMLYIGEYTRIASQDKDETPCIEVVLL